jgi:hypothetical protein
VDAMFWRLSIFASAYGWAVCISIGLLV